ncbi:hypothetical protein RJT34_10905 [Clitoria ternatea]|uniref:TF-B3 domain-containing protein n=1 Tax=Clitoria ternatea TaxID=43366 RepID=A0AAN9JLP7_CLITE
MDSPREGDFFEICLLAAEKGIEEVTSSSMLFHHSRKEQCNIPSHDDVTKIEEWSKDEEKSNLSSHDSNKESCNGVDSKNIKEPCEDYDEKKKRLKREGKKNVIHQETKKAKKKKEQGNNDSSSNNKDISNNNGDVPELPKEFKEKIEELHGGEAILVIQKRLFKCDVGEVQGRLSIPIRQIRAEAKNFLTQEELLTLNKTEGKNQKLVGLPLFMLDPHLREWRGLVLKKWCMTNSDTYNIVHEWMKFVEANNLKVNDVVQLWTFRSHDGMLSFALVKL